MIPYAKPESVNVWDNGRIIAKRFYPNPNDAVVYLDDALSPQFRVTAVHADGTVQVEDIETRRAYRRSPHRLALNGCFLPYDEANLQWSAR